MRRVLLSHGQYNSGARLLTRAGMWAVIWVTLTVGMLHAASLPGTRTGSIGVNPSNVMFTCRGNDATTVFNELWQQGGTRVFLNSVNYWHPQIPVALRFHPMSAHTFVEMAATGMGCRVLWACNGKYAIMGEKAPEAVLSEIRADINSGNWNRFYRGLNKAVAIGHGTYCAFA